MSANDSLGNQTFVFPAGRLKWLLYQSHNLSFSFEIFATSDLLCCGLVGTVFLYRSLNLNA